MPNQQSIDSAVSFISNIMVETTLKAGMLLKMELGQGDRLRLIFIHVKEKLNIQSGMTRNVGKLILI